MDSDAGSNELEKCDTRWDSDAGSNELEKSDTRWDSDAGSYELEKCDTRWTVMLVAMNQRSVIQDGQ